MISIVIEKNLFAITDEDVNNVKIMKEEEIVGKKLSNFPIYEIFKKEELIYVEGICFVLARP